MIKKIATLLILLLTTQVSYAAIAFDTAVAETSTNGVTSKTISITTSGSNRILWAIMGQSTSVTSSGCTYNSAAMTLATTTAHQFGARLNLYYIIAPSLGANSLTCSVSGASNISLGAISFTGADQTTQPDAVSAATTTGTVSYSQSVTSVADNSFAVLGLFAQSGATLTGGSNTTIGSQPEVTAYGTAFAYSTSGKTPPGTFTLNVTSASQNFSGVMASFKPAFSTSTTPSTAGFFRMLKYR